MQTQAVVYLYINVEVMLIFFCLVWFSCKADLYGFTKTPRQPVKPSEHSRQGENILINTN